MFTHDTKWIDTYHISIHRCFSPDEFMKFAKFQGVKKERR